MKIIVDNKIPYITETIESIADEVIYLSGSEFSAKEVQDADALIIRTRTHCNRELLEGSKVQFIATATIGYDHIDTEFCEKAGITWTNAPGCNAGSVSQYIHSSLLLLKKEKSFDLQNTCIGIVGVGNVGTKVKQLAESLGMRVLLNDPPKADQGQNDYVSLDTIANECDIITFHTPLNREGKYQTFHLADENFFRLLKKKPVIINTSRGEVIKTQAISDALQSGKIKEAIIDVWENEPKIDLNLLQKVFIGTPHIAGYSADGKANATKMSLESLCCFYHIDKDIHIEPPAPEITNLDAYTEDEAYLQMYDPGNDSRKLKTHPQDFEKLRGNYPLRREKEAYHIPHL